MRFLWLVWFALAVVLMPRSLHAAWSVRPTPPWVVPVDVPPPGSTGDTNGERILLVDEQVRVGTTTDRYVRTVRQITNEAGLSSSSQVSIGFDPTHETLALHTVIVHRGSQKLERLDSQNVKIVQREPNLETQMFDGRQSAVLFIPDLRVGDVVETASSIHDDDPTREGHFSDVVFLGGPSAIDHLFECITAPATQRLRWRPHGPDGANREPAVSEQGGMRTLTWDLRDLRAYPTDPSVPASYYAFPILFLSDYESWSDVSAWGERLFRVTLPTRGPLFDWVRSQRAGATRDQFLQRAIRFVQDEVRYVAIEVGIGRLRPTDPSIVFERRYGDCKDKTGLLVAILRLGGVEDVMPALVNSSEGETLTERPPSQSAFDHVIVRLGGSERVLWIDPTDLLHGGGLDRMQYSSFRNALPLSGNAGLEKLAQAPVLRPQRTIVERFVVALPGAAEEARLEVERTYEDFFADRMRAQLRGNTTADVSKYLLQLYQADFPGLKEIAPSEQTDNREHNVLRIVGHFSLAKIWERDGNGFKAVVTARAMEQMLDRPASARTAPLAFPHPANLRETMEIELPFDLASTPEQLSVGSDAFNLDFSSTRADVRHVTYTWSLTTRKDTVPLDDVGVHLERIDGARALLVRSLLYRDALPDGFNWGIFLGLIGCMPFAVWGAIRGYRFDRKPRVPVVLEPKDAPLVGIGGWLLLLMLVVVTAPIVNSIRGVQWLRAILSLAVWQQYTTPGLDTYAPAYAILMVVETVIMLAVACYGVALLVLFFQKRRSFPIQFMVYLGVVAAFGIVDAIASKLMMNEVDTTFAPRLVFVVVWIAYLQSSRRVRVTFVNAPPKRKRP